MPRTPNPTSNDAVTEEILTLEQRELVDAIAKQERHPQTESRIVSLLFTGDEWQKMDAWDSFRRGCEFNGRCAALNERLLRHTIRLYGLTFSDAPESFRTVGVY